MTLANFNKILKPDYLMLLPIMALAFYIAYIPHLNYPYPLHVDEWLHIVNANATLRADGVIGLGSNLEAGFHLLWGVFHEISGISWMTIARYFPPIVFIITVLSVYILAQREGFGWEAAFFASLIPTTVGILGPAFLVPMAMGLLFTPLLVFLAFNFRTVWSYLLIFIFTCFLLAIHAPSAIYPIIILAPYILINLRSNFKHSLGLILALALPFLAVFPWIFDLLLPTAQSLFTPQSVAENVQLPRIIQTYGYLPILFGLLGTFLLAVKGGKKNYGLALGLLTMLLMLVTFYTFQYGVPIMYERGLTYMMLLMGIVAGAGLAWVRNLKLAVKLSDRLRAPLLTKNVGNILCLVLIGITLATVIPDRQDTPYYHMIDREDYQAFVWIQENIGDNYQKAIVDPWKATAFSAITEKSVYSRIHKAPEAEDNEAYAFIRGGSKDTSFLRQNGISIIYTRVYEGGQNRNIEFSSDNPDLVEIAKNVYLLK